MHVTLGLTHDSQQGPSPRSQFNAPVVGPLGFLSLLETYLGLSAPEVATAQRVATFMGLLQQHDDGARFYSRSLEVDGVGTAARLLAWRDEWRMGGWRGEAHPGHPARLREMAQIESAAACVLPPGLAERLVSVLEALRDSGPGPIEQVTLLDPKEDFPFLWQEVLNALPEVETLPPRPQGEGQLREVQERALQLVSGRHEPPLALSDGSVQVFRALSATTAQHWLSSHQHAAPADRLLLAEASGDALDTVLASTGGVKCGFEARSALRPAFQALGLALELCWEPLDVGHLMAFLTHPVGPFSRAARAMLARAVHEQPGIGGPAWMEAKARLGTFENGDALNAEADFWLESDRFRRSEGAPVEALVARVDRLKDSFRKRLSAEPLASTTFSPAHRQCAAVLEGLRVMQRQGIERLVPRELEQLLAWATPGGAANPTAVAQVGCTRSASDAAACTEPADEVIWWMPGAPALAQPLPWTPSEVRALRELGVHLRDPARELAAQASRWLRPLLAARKRFVLVLPPGEAEVHPIRQLLRALAGDLEATATDLDAALDHQQLGQLAERVQPLPLPATPARIQLAKPLDISHVKQSYTALDELFNCPALFVLKRIAKLSPTSILAAEEDNRLLGTLGHRVLELLFAQEEALAWSDARALAWFSAVADELLRTEGAVLLMEGTGVSRQRFRMVCERAICGLLAHLRAAGAVRVRTEVEVSGSFGPVPLFGKVDILVEFPGDRTVALDVKWRGDTYYGAVLREGRFLQLALYSSLIEQQTGTTPAALGYFLLESGSLFVTHEGLFPHAQLRRPPDGVTTETLLSQARATWSWRTAELEAGQVAVVPYEPTPEDQGPEGTLFIDGPRKWDRDHLVLLGGWEQ